jgi:hypothetical protein
VVADSANTPRMVVQDNGNVGIGTAAPSANFYVDNANNGFVVRGIIGQSADYFQIRTNSVSDSKILSFSSGGNLNINGGAGGQSARVGISGDSATPLLALLRGGSQSGDMMQVGRNDGTRYFT